jgi:molybdate transport system substrate-binding protein
MKALRTLTIALGLILTGMTMASANELNVIIGGSLSALFKELGPQFESASGHKLSIHFDSTPNIIARINAGTPFDAVVVPVDVFKDATARSHFVTTSFVEIARVGYGVIVRAGAAKPDISKPSLFKQALLDAKSIAYLPESAAGTYITKLFVQLGIGEQMRAKTKVQASPAEIAPAVARGEAELGIFVINILMAPGVEFAGPFPPVLQQELSYVAAISANTGQTEAAQALIDFLKSQPAIAAIKAAGMSLSTLQTY